MADPGVVRTTAVPRVLTHEPAKATIVNTFTRESFGVMYNPDELKLEQGNTFAEVGVPGLGTPPVQYVRGKARILSMELFFDSYEEGTDVRRLTSPVVALLDKDPREQAPPVLLFSLGRLQFQCVLVEAGQRFTMFLRDGTPVRSTLSVRFQEYVRVEVDVRQGLFFGSPTVSAAVNAVGTVIGVGTTLHVTTASDTLSGIAGAYLGDPGLWREIARANRIDDPLNLPPGRTLVIPPRTGAGRTGAAR
ncbi:LysM peptidoglycan-binding domain-containing protein [Streptomyces sp. NBC_00124]|uniref:CIS tube protein n=1 Tax=Streptomyces sp. NBC_00124 TaxID=2975662 RepID=UPI002250B600|nr:LysM peptidoglycan-binding domain-containing protein [Streptomyces sp. NBC_00124]MCX5357762.1 LysM peptidoglycan-binding domain-containing protein [Streptomyces sp. NBC_00124]